MPILQFSVEMIFPNLDFCSCNYVLAEVDFFDVFKCKIDVQITFLLRQFAKIQNFHSNQ